MKITPEAADAFAAAFAAKPSQLVSPPPPSEKPARENRFWIVWNPLHPTTPAVRHKKKVSAEMAAKKLCRQHPELEGNIYVLQPCSAWRMGAERPKGRHF